MTMTCSDKIAQALFDCLSDCEPKDLEQLKTEIAEFKTKYHRSYDGVQRVPFAAKMLTAMEEAIESRGV